MRVISFNVNSLRARLDHLYRVIEKHSPDIIGLQETKVSDDDFPVDAIHKMGYQVVFQGQKTHYGVALLSKTPCLQVVKGFDHDNESSQKRLIRADYRVNGNQTLTVINGYFPQGENRGHPEKFPAKQRFYENLLSVMQASYDPHQLLLLMGDMNVALHDQDVGIGENNVKRWLKEGKCCFLPEERTWFEDLVSWGLSDTFRYHNPDISDLFSWFDYRSKGFEDEPRRGIRIDHILATASLLETSIDAGIDYEIRGLEKPSDHCPIWADFSISLA